MPMYYIKPLWVGIFDGVDWFFKWDKRTTSYEETFLIPSFLIIIEGFGWWTSAPHAQKYYPINNFLVHGKLRYRGEQGEHDYWRSGVEIPSKLFIFCVKYDRPWSIVGTIKRHSNRGGMMRMDRVGTDGGYCGRRRNYHCVLLSE